MKICCVRVREGVPFRKCLYHVNLDIPCLLALITMRGIEPKFQVCSFRRRQHLSEKIRSDQIRSDQYSLQVFTYPCSPRGLFFVSFLV